MPSVRSLVGVGCALAALAVIALPSRAHAGAGVYLQGRGVAGADNPGELSPGTLEPAHGTGFGWRVGARLLLLDVFVDRTHFGAGTADRAVLGFSGDLELGRMRLRGAAGTGAMRLRGGALGSAEDSEATGALARAALSFDVSVGAGFWLGAEVETSVYRVVPAGGSIIDDSVGGAVVLASLQLGFELGM